MSRKQGSHGKKTNSLHPHAEQLPRPSNSTVWNAACQRADELIDRGQWTEARDVLEEVERTHPGGNAVMSRLAEVYEELGQMDSLAAVNSRCNPALIQLEKTVKLYEDKLRGLSVFNFEIDYEPLEVQLSPVVREWAYEAHEALQEGRSQEAERLLKQCIETEGDAPDLLNNLATAYSQQRRDEESYELVQQIHDRWPEYFFGRIAMANIATIEGRYRVAQEHLEPLLAKRRYHIAEFRALAVAYIQLQIELKEMDTAQIWIDVWKSIDPSHAQLKQLEERISANSIPSLFGRLLGLHHSFFDK